MAELLKVVIVGSEQSSWAYDEEARAKKWIREFMMDHPDYLYMSGDCPYGGVDKWVREIAKELNKSFKPFPPQKNKWYYYRKRNMQMAREGDLIIDLEPKGVTSGGTWTADYADSIGKITLRIGF